MENRDGFVYFLNKIYFKKVVPISSIVAGITAATTYFDKVFTVVNYINFLFIESMSFLILSAIFFTAVNRIFISTILPLKVHNSGDLK